MTSSSPRICAFVVVVLQGGRGGGERWTKQLMYQNVKRTCHLDGFFFLFCFLKTAAGFLIEKTQISIGPNRTKHIVLI